MSDGAYDRYVREQQRLLAEENARLKAERNRLETDLGQARQRIEQLLQRAKNAETARDQLAAGTVLVCSDERHTAKVRGLEAALLDGQKATEHWEGAYVREVAAHGQTEAQLAAMRSQCERWRYMPDRKRAAEEMLAVLDRVKAQPVEVRP